MARMRPTLRAEPPAPREAPLQHEDVALAEAGELAGERKAGDAAADDDDVGAL